MTIRLAVFLSLLAAIPSPPAAYGLEQPLVLRLQYTTRFGGLKQALPPPGRIVPKLGLALAGGGARAAASVGVLRVLEQEGIPITVIAGTSMGSGVGGLYAAGYSPAEIERIFLDNDWNDIFSDTPPRAFQTQEQKEATSRHILEFTFTGEGLVPPAGLSAGQKLTNLLASKTLAASFEADMDFDRLRVPFRAVATDIETGEAVALGTGLLHEALRASSAIPLVFQPVEINGRLLVDGGMSNNLPVDIVRSLGADVVIAVDPSARLEKKEQLSSLVDIFNQSISLQVRRETERQAKLADLVIVPQTDAYSFTDFPSMAAIIRTGEEAARDALPRIRQLMQPRGPSPGAARYRIADLVIRGNANVSAELIRSAMASVLASRDVTEQGLEGALADVFAIGSFSDVALELNKQGSAYRAVLFVRENPVVREIVVRGNTIIPGDEINTALAWQSNEPFNGARLAADLDRLTRKMRQMGYLLARVSRAGMTGGGTLEIEFFEGRVDSITLSGHRRTRRSLIQRETESRAGKPLNFNVAERDLQHLYALDYFESLDVDMAESSKGGVDIALRIKEKPTNRIRLGLRYDLEDSFTGLTDIVADNITGRGIKVYLNTRYGNYTDLTLGYRSPVILRSYFVHVIEAYYRDRTYSLYADKRRMKEIDIARNGIDVAFGYQWFRFGDTYIRYRYASDTTTETVGLAPSEEIHRIGSWAILSTVDTRDRHTFPHSGILFKGSYENASESVGSTSDFTKTTFLGQTAVPVAERHTIMLEASAGLGSGFIPYQELYGIGGADYVISTPLLGYQRREFVGPNLLAFSLGWQWKISEYQLNVVRGIYVRLAAQAANVWESREAMAVKDLRGGAGIGLHADTIIGPFRLDVGFGEDDRTQVYFSAGFDF